MFDPQDMGDFAGEKLSALCNVAIAFASQTSLTDFKKVEVSLDWTRMDDKLLPVVKVNLEK